MDPVAVAARFAIGGLHQKHLEVIRRPQILRNAGLAHGFLAIRTVRI
jgi:hypothetical protein